MKENILIGTSGWGYDEWKDPSEKYPFYPRSLKSKDYLPFYSKVFYTTEINTTFYNIPSEWVVKNWVEKTPSDFIFTAKLNKSITHEEKLNCNSCLDRLDYFLRAMEPLISSKKLLAFLIQLPPSFTKEKHFGALQEFVDNWPEKLRSFDDGGYHLVVEFRHKSWMDDEVFSYLSDHSLTYCAVIEPLLPPRMDITTQEFAYIRFHGYGKKPWFNYFFKEEEIKNWAVKVEEVIQKAGRVGIYFNNHFSGYAAKNSLMMMKELNLEPRNMPEDIEILEIKKDSGLISKGQTSLDKFF